MKFLQKNQRGLTILELLVALSVSTIVIIIIAGVMISVVNQFTYTVTHSQLRQEANILVTSIESEYLNGNGTFTIRARQQGLEIGSNYSSYTGYDVVMEITNRSSGLDTSFSTVPISEGSSECVDESTQASTVQEVLMNQDNLDGYTILITFYPKGKPCDSFELKTNLSKL